MSRSAAELMWAEAISTLARMDHLHRTFFHPDPQGWEPPVDVLETPDELVIMVALPGVEADQVELVVHDDSLAVVGVRRLPGFLHNARVLRMELPHGRFERRVGIPPGRYELTRRNLTDGLLVVALRKVA
ncbi:MAG: Hsp20/alpha crystallin family protein [Rhodospirillales bacterium]|nr:Hsp20/alpha crystallin family protein [Acetobacter sp.]